MCSAICGTSRYSCSCKIANVRRCACSNTQALGLNDLEPHQLAVGCIPSNSANVVHHRTTENSHLRAGNLTWDLFLSSQWRCHRAPASESVLRMLWSWMSYGAYGVLEAGECWIDMQIGNWLLSTKINPVSATCILVQYWTSIRSMLSENILVTQLRIHICFLKRNKLLSFSIHGSYSCFWHGWHLQQS